MFKLFKKKEKEVHYIKEFKKNYDENAKYLGLNHINQENAKGLVNNFIDIENSRSWDEDTSTNMINCSKLETYINLFYYVNTDILSNMNTRIYLGNKEDTLIKRYNDDYLYYIVLNENIDKDQYLKEVTEDVTYLSKLMINGFKDKYKDENLDLMIVPIIELKKIKIKDIEYTTEFNFRLKVTILMN